MVCSLSGGLFLSPKAFALQCQSLLRENIELSDLIDQEQLRSREERRTIEVSLHNNIGGRSLKLHLALTDIFNLNKETIPSALTLEVQSAFASDPIASQLPKELQNRIIWLIHQKFTPPYIAFFIVRYIDSVVYSDNLSFEKLQNINSVINSYIYERALLISKRKLRSHPHPENEQSVLRYVTGVRTYNPGYINHNNPSRIMILSSMFRDTLREVEDEIASEAKIYLN